MKFSEIQKSDLEQLSEKRNRMLRKGSGQDLEVD